MKSPVLHNEQELMLRVAQHDEQAFSQLMLHYSGLIHSFLYKHTSRAELVEELANDVFLHIWLTRETLSVINNFGKYLFVLCRNRALTAIRKEIRHRNRNSEWAILNEGEDTSEEDAFVNEGIRIIDEAIAQLSPQQQRAWVLSRRKGLTYVQIAGELGISKETVKTHLQAANQAIGRYVVKHMDALFCILLLSKKI